MFSVAKQRLPDKVREHRSRYESIKSFASGKMTVGDAAQVYLHKTNAKVSLKLRTKQYYADLIAFISRSWAALMAARLSSCRKSGCPRKPQLPLSTGFENTPPFFRGHGIAAQAGFPSNRAQRRVSIAGAER